LFATDFSHESERALSYAKSIVRGSRGELLLIHVVQLAPTSPPERWIWTDDSVRVRAEEEETKQAAAALRAEGLKVRCFYPFGEVGQSVVQGAERYHADLVIAATHGRRGLNRLIFGSHAEEIAASLKNPLLIIGPRAPLANAAIWRPTRILCLTSMSAGEVTLLSFAYSIAKKYGAHFDVVFSDATGSEDRVETQWLEYRESVREHLSNDDSDEFPSHIIHLREPKAESLVQAVIARNVDLLVVGVRHRDWLPRRQSPLECLLANVPCPIMTFPTRGA
jgi:nucleotide-binding universal stress UspA family protein